MQKTKTATAIDLAKSNKYSMHAKPRYNQKKENG
jgi:hypothetical protein